MKFLRLIICSILLLGIFEAEQISQFHVNSKVELNIDIENGHPDPPGRIVLIGNDPGNREIYFAEIGLNKSKKHTIYNVKPGKYLIAFNCQTGGIFSEIQIVTLYDDQQQTFSRESFVRNEIEVCHNRNLKLDFLFKTNYDFSGFNKVTEKKFNYYDYIKIIYYSSLSDYNPAALQFNQKSNDLLVSNEENFTKGPSLQVNEANSYTPPDCEVKNICGNNGCPQDDDKCNECKVDLNALCSRDGGYININLKSVYFKNKWLGEVPTGTQFGTTIIGERDNSGKWMCGVCSIYFSSPIGKGSAQAPSNWPTTEVKCSCVKEKCKLDFTYYVGVVMETAVWGIAEMCAHTKSFMNKPIDGDNTCYCECFFEATVAHEKNHCELWIESSEKLEEYCDEIGEYTTSTCCKEDKDCESEATVIEWQIFADLVKFVGDIYNEREGALQEPSCDKVEAKAFKKCIRLKNCRPNK